MTCLNPPNPLVKGAHQGLRAFHRRTATLPANSGPASDDALFGTRGRRLRSRRAWSSRRLLVAGHDHIYQTLLEIVAGHDCFREACPERKTEQPEIDTTDESIDSQPVSR